MPMHKRKIRRQTQPIRRPPPKFAGPVIEPFPEEEGAFSSAQRLVKEYAEMVDGHHAALRQFLQRCYPVVRRFQREPDEFERLKADPFWGMSRQRPKDASRSKWVMYFIMQATTTNVRSRAGRYAVLLDGLIREKVRPDTVAARIKDMRGVEAAQEAMRARKRGKADKGQDCDEEAEADHDDAGDAEVGNDAEVSLTGRSALKSSRTGDRVVSGTRKINLDHALVIEPADDILKRILDAGARCRDPKRYYLAVTVFPKDADGWVRVVGDQMVPIAQV
jgi:hypothetical protein